LSPATAATGTPRIDLRRVTKTFVTDRGEVNALGPVDLAVAPGELLVLVGPSGCGKTTLLNLVAGFERPTSGEVLFDGQPVTAPGADRVMLFQEPALFPWLSVLDNVAFGLANLPGVPATKRRALAQWRLEQVHLEGFADAFVHELSGGMKQRAALARALAIEPGALLCDEPFGALDALSRERLYAEVQEIHATSGATIVFVTHNTREAACLADRVVVLSERPALLKHELRVDLPRPRDFYDPRVSELAREILCVLRGNDRRTGTDEEPA
jgi:NitT/TauT family transport system ATP-binding protein